MNKLFITALLTLLILNPVSAQSSPGSCLSDSSKATLGELADGNQNVSQSDLESVYGDLCQRDQTYYDLTQSEMDSFESDMEDQINNSLSDARTDLRAYVRSQLTDMNDLADTLEGLDQAIKSNVEVQNQISNISSRVDSIEQSQENQASELRDVFVTESEMNTQVNSTKNWARGQFAYQDTTVTFWDWSPIGKLPMFGLLVAICVGLYVGWKNDKLPEWVYEIGLFERSGSELSQEEIEAIEQGVNQADEETETFQEEVEEAENPSPDDLEDLQEEKEEVTAEKEFLEGMLKKYKEKLQEEYNDLKGKGARRSKEDEERMEEIQEELEELELNLGV